jgi:hypothetical protein
MMTARKKHPGNDNGHARLTRPLLAIALGAVLLAACSGASGSAPAKVALVIGQRSNSVVIGDSPQLDALVQRLVAERAEVSFVVCDGQPALVRTLDLGVSAPNSLYARQETAANQRLAETTVASTTATSPEADPLTAIGLAGRAVADGSGAREVVVFDSGLQTVAPLRFQDGLLSESPATVVSFLRGTGELPDLRGIRVTWYGLGQTRAPQASLTTAAFRQLQAIWTAILRAAGAASVSIDVAPLPLADDPGSLPPVSLVPIAPVASLGSEFVISLDPTAVGFLPNEAVYRDPARADAVLAVVAHEILAGGYHHVTLTGTTALPPGLALSLARAERVAETLVSDGVPSSSLTVRGVGTRFAGFVPDVNPDRTLNGAAAQRDRLVIIAATR